MLHKNVRSLLYYVAGVTLVCLMIELSKRGSGLEPQLYVVETVKKEELAALPSPVLSVGEGEAEEIIPRRNRGRPGTNELYQGANPKPAAALSEREQFKQWKASMKISPEEVGLFKKWKQEQGRSKKQMKLKSIGDGTSQVRNEITDDERENYNKGDGDEKEEERQNEEENAIDVKEKSKPLLEVEETGGYGDPDEDDDDDLEGVSPVMEYDPPDSQHSCTDLTMTDTLLERAKNVREACDRLQDELGGQRRLYSRFRWAVPERLLYCPVFKAASTTWLVNYLSLANSTSNPKSGNLHKKITDLFPPPGTNKLRKRIFDESTKFIVVRHPFERFVSAYRDKLAGFSRNPHYLETRKYIIKNYRKNRKSKSEIPTFREAVDFVLAELDKRESNGKEKILIDGHFTPYSERCLPCAMKYDVIIKMESLEEDSNYLIEQCGLQDRLKISHENPAPTGPETAQGTKNKSKGVRKGKEKAKVVNSTGETALKYFRDIPTSKIRQLYQHYRHDFEIFGYSASEYLADDGDER